LKCGDASLAGEREDKVYDFVLEEIPE